MIFSYYSRQKLTDFRVSHQSSELRRFKLCVSARSGLENGHSSAGSERFLLWPVLPGDSSSKRSIRERAHTHAHTQSHVTSLSLWKQLVCVGGSALIASSKNSIVAHYQQQTCSSPRALMDDSLITVPTLSKTKTAFSYLQFSEIEPNCTKPLDKQGGQQIVSMQRSIVTF